jgi:hypothetical protein
MSRSKSDSRTACRGNIEDNRGDGSGSHADIDVCAQDRKLGEIGQEQSQVDFVMDKGMKESLTVSNTGRNTAIGSGDYMSTARTDNAGNTDFVWKREGKKWLKIPVAPDDGNLRSIVDERNNLVVTRIFDDSYSHGSRNTQFSHNEHEIMTPQSVQSNNLQNLEPGELDRLEQALIDEALQRSLNTVHQSSVVSMSTGSPVIHMSERSPVSRSSRFPQGYGSIAINSGMLQVPPFAYPEPEHPTFTPEPHRHDLGIQDRDVTPLVMERNLLDRSYHSISSHASYESSRSGASFANQTQQSRPPRPMPHVSSYDRLDGAGCHLAMICARKPSTRAILNNIDYEEDEEELMAENIRLSRSSSGRFSTQRERRVGDSAGISSAGVKLIWKRGPNNLWGKYPESDEYEDAAFQEAMKRSLIDR